MEYGIEDNDNDNDEDFHGDNDENFVAKLGIISCLKSAAVALICRMNVLTVFRLVVFTHMFLHNIRVSLLNTSAS